MAQHDYVINNDTAPNVRSDINLALAAIASNNSGATEPATTYANMFWYDTDTDVMKQRNENNSAWVTLELTPTTLVSLTQAQAEDDASTVFGTVSGQRLGQAIAKTLPIVYTDEYTATTAHTAVIPYDNTVPLIGEGTEILSVTSVVVATGRQVVVNVCGLASNTNNAGRVTLALFRGSTCIGVGHVQVQSSSVPGTITILTNDAPSAGTYTYSVRVGPAANTAYMNADASGVRVFGGASRTSLTVTVI